MKKLLAGLGLVLVFCGLALAQAGPENVLIQRGAGPETLPFPSDGNVMYFRTGRFMGRGMGAWWKNPELAQKVGLSDDQTQQLEKISYQSKLQMIDLRATLEKEQLNLHQQLESDQPNEDSVLGQVDKVAEARAAIEKARVQTMLATRKVLTPDQWKKLRAARREFRPKILMRQRPGGGFARHDVPMPPDTPPLP